MNCADSSRKKYSSKKIWATRPAALRLGGGARNERLTSASADASAADDETADEEVTACADATVAALPPSASSSCC